MNVIHNNWKNSMFNKKEANIYIENRVVHLKGDNYSRYIYYLFNEFSYVNSVDRLYKILLSRISEVISFDKFFDIINKLVEYKILILFENEIISESENFLNFSIIDFSYSGIIEKFKDIISFKGDLYISNNFFKKDKTNIQELNFYNLEEEMGNIKNNKVIVFLINRNNFKILKSLFDLDLKGNEYILPVFIDSNIMIIGSIISKDLEFSEKYSFTYQFEYICRKYFLNHSHFSCDENFLISSLGIINRELKELIKILNGEIGFSKIFNNSVIYNFNTGKIYYEKFLKYKYELERILEKNG